MSASPAERVAAGVAYLDEHDPSWWRADTGNAIRLSQLDLGDANSCILGQRCPAERLQRSGWPFPYEAQLRYITRGHGVWVSPGEWAIQHGFAAGEGHAGYHKLTQEWKRVIRDRRRAAAGGSS
jgi:hypothetical protein